VLQGVVTRELRAELIADASPTLLCVRMLRAATLLHPRMPRASSRPFRRVPAAVSPP
jgi:hypothetical protein